MKASERGLALIRSFEGLRLLAYKDLGGVVTIGYGTTAGVKMGDTVTKAEAEELLRLDVQRFVDHIAALVTVYTDGVARSTLTTANRPSAPGTLTYVATDAGAIGASMNGYLDELRVTIGVARYGGNFTPPSTPFQDA